MKIRWIKIILGAIAAEAAAVVILICFVAIFGPSTTSEASAFAEKHGYWLGPVAGVVFSFLGALWVSRRLVAGQLLHGTLFGLVYAAFDVAILVAMRAAFDWIFVISDGGKLIAGIMGGFLAAKRSVDIPRE